MKTWDEVVEGYRERWIEIFSQGVEGFSEQACREIVYALTPKTGHWIRHERGLFFGCKCSRCGRLSEIATDFCPGCGSYNGGK